MLLSVFSSSERNVEHEEVLVQAFATGLAAQHLGRNT